MLDKFTTTELRGLFERYEHEKRGNGPDMVEVERFLEWVDINSEAHAEPQWLSDPERSEVIDVLTKVSSLPAGCLSDEEALEEAREVCERLQRHKGAASNESTIASALRPPQKYWLKVSINDEAWMDTEPPSEFEDQTAYYRASGIDNRLAVLGRALTEYPLDGLRQLSQIARSEYGWKADHEQAEHREAWATLTAAIAWIDALPAEPSTSPHVHEWHTADGERWECACGAVRE